MSVPETSAPIAEAPPRGHLILAMKFEERVIMRVPGLPDIELQLERCDRNGRVWLGFRAAKNVQILREGLARVVRPGEQLRRTGSAA